MADEDVEFAEDEVVEEQGSNGSDSTNKKYITATLNKDADEDLISSYDLLRQVGGFDNRAIVEAGIKALFASDEFKQRAQKLKNVLK